MVPVACILKIDASRGLKRPNWSTITLLGLKLNLKTFEILSFKIIVWYIFWKIGKVLAKMS
jgi:hypothetical protein